MNEMTSDEKGTEACCPQSAPSNCCQPGDTNMSSCCGTGTGSWSKGKTLISGIVIVAAVVVGAYSFGKEPPPNQAIQFPLSPLWQVWGSSRSLPKATRLNLRLDVKKLCSGLWTPCRASIPLRPIRILC